MFFLFNVHPIIIQSSLHSIYPSVCRLDPSVGLLMACRGGGPAVHRGLCCSWRAHLSPHTNIWGPIFSSRLSSLNIDLSVVGTFPQVQFRSLILSSPLIIKPHSAIHWPGTTGAHRSAAAWRNLIMFCFVPHFEMGCSLVIFEFLWHFICWVRIFLIQNFFACRHIVFFHLRTNFTKFEMMPF